MPPSNRDQQSVRGYEPTDLIVAHSELLSDVDSLANKHAMFSELLDRNGRPPLWRREPSYATLVRFILEQQVSLCVG